MFYHNINGKRFWKRIDTCTCITQSLCCMPENNILLLINYAAATAKSLQSCPTLCGPIDGSPPGSPVPGILQARTLEWVAISFSNAWKWKVKVKSLSHVWLLATSWTAAYQAPPSMGFSRQEYWSILKYKIKIEKINCIIHKWIVLLPEKYWISDIECWMKILQSLYRVYSLYYNYKVN